jgi:hypothetical protein
MSLGFVEISIDRVISQLITSYNYRHHIVVDQHIATNNGNKSYNIDPGKPAAEVSQT